MVWLDVPKMSVSLFYFKLLCVAFAGHEDSLGDEDSTRAVRVTTIAAGGGDRVFGVYEIRMPRRGLFSRAVAPPPPFSTALQNSSPIYYIDPEEPPPSYDDYLKTQPSQSSEDTVTQVKESEPNKY